MDIAISFLLLLILGILIFGVPILLLVIRLIETISERRDQARRAGGESMTEEKAPVEKRSRNDASDLTPANHMR